jgi:hypothetical protein
MRLGLLWLAAAAAVAPAFGGPILFSIPSPASSFGLLGGAPNGVSNTGTSVVTGNVGGTTTVSGFPPGTASGFACTPTSGAPCTSGNDSEVTTAFNQIFGEGGAFSVGEGLTSSGLFTSATSQTFLGNTVYASSGTISTVTGTNLIFDAQSNPNAVFVIQVNGDYTVNGAMTFTLQNGAQANNIFWVVEDAATISVGSSGPIVFDGDILAGTSFTMSAAAGGSGTLAGTINGCVFSQDTNTLGGQTDIGGCSGAGSGGSVPEPGSAGLVSLGGLLGLLGWRKFGVRA